MEMVEVQLALDAAIYVRYRGLLKSCARSAQRNPKCNVHFDEKNMVPGANIEVLLSGTDREALMAAKRALDKVLIRNTIGKLSPPPRPSRQTHRLVLTRTSDYVCATTGGGVRKAQEIFGEDIVYLDTASSSAAIMVWGDTSMLRQVQRCLNWYGSLPQRNKVFCEVCWDEGDDFVKMEGCRDVAARIALCSITR
jgi:hypothetical protein